MIIMTAIYYYISAHIPHLHVHMRPHSKMLLGATKTHPPAISRGALTLGNPCSAS